MYLLYADESGNSSGTQNRHFVLAGVSVFERKAHWLSLELDRIAERFDPIDAHKVELHGSPMHGGKNRWRRVGRAERQQAIKDALSLIDGFHYRLFAAVVRREAISPDDAVVHTFEQVITRFDRYLTREYVEFDNPQRGLLVFDKTTHERPLQRLARHYKQIGHQWGSLRNMADVPMFADSEATRLIQLADLAAFALFRHYEHGDSQYYDVISNRFDYAGGIRHGLYERL